MRREYNNVRELQQAQGSHDFAEDWTAQCDPWACWSSRTLLYSRCTMPPKVMVCCLLP